MCHNKRLLYYKLQCKRIFRQLPHIFLGILLLGIVIGTISFFTGKLLYVNKYDGNLQVAYTSDDENKMTSMFLNILTNSNSVSTACKFINTSRSEAERLLQQEKVLAALYIPANFMDGLLTGDNYSITVSLPQHLSLYSIITVEMMNAIDNTLSAAQAGIYTLYDYYKEEDILEKEDAANAELNSIYLSQALDRSSTFKNYTVTAAGELSMAEYFLCGGIVLVLLLLGCSFAESIQLNENAILYQKLKQAGISIPHMIFSRIVAVTAVMYTIFSSGILIYWILNLLHIVDTDFTGFSALVLGLVNGLLICLCSACFIVCVLSFTNSRTSGILLLFLIVIISGFLSGCLIPALFLPDVVHQIANWLPTTYMMETAKDILNPEFTPGNLLAVFLSAVVLCGISIGACCLRGRKELV